MVDKFRDVFAIIPLGDVSIFPEFHVEDIVVLVHSKAGAKKDGSGAAWNSPPVGTSPKAGCQQKNRYTVKCSYLGSQGSRNKHAPAMLGGTVFQTRCQEKEKKIRRELSTAQICACSKPRTSEARSRSVTAATESRGTGGGA